MTYRLFCQILRPYLLVKFHSEIKLSLSMVKTVYTFSPGWNFSPGWTHACEKETGIIFYLGMKKKKMCKHFLLGRNLTISMFLLNFWRIYSICFPTLTCLYKVKVFKKYIIGRAYKKWSPKNYYSINYLFLFLFLFLFCKVYKRLEVPFVLIIIVKFHVFY